MAINTPYCAIDFISKYITVTLDIRYLGNNLGDIVSSPIYIYQQFTVFMYYHQLYRLNPLNHADDFQNVNVTTTLIIYLFHRKCNLEISFFNNPNQLKQKSPIVPPRISDGGHDLVNNTTFYRAQITAKSSKTLFVLWIDDATQSSHSSMHTNCCVHYNSPLCHNLSSQGHFFFQNVNKIIPFLYHLLTF